MNLNLNARCEPTRGQANLMEPANGLVAGPRALPLGPPFRASPTKRVPWPPHLLVSRLSLVMFEKLTAPLLGAPTFDWAGRMAAGRTCGRSWPESAGRPVGRSATASALEAAPASQDKDSSATKCQSLPAKSNQTCSPTPLTSSPARLSASSAGLELNSPTPPPSGTLVESTRLDPLSLGPRALAAR